MERLNSSLERFIPREVLGLLHKKDITEIALGDYIELRLTVFFMDIRDFTTLSEAMTPQDNFRFINSFLNRFGPLIRAHGGFVDKYLGDGIMALFPGAPGDAVRTACAMRAELASYNADRGRAGYPPVEFGIGIHTGALMLGTIGENRRMDSTVISDTVNSASRLEGLTKNFGRPVLISGATLAALTAEEQEWFVHIGDELVKGKTRRLEVWALDRPCV
jgi:class 3 adenylate cyclase